MAGEERKNIGILGKVYIGSPGRAQKEEVALRKVISSTSTIVSTGSTCPPSSDLAEVKARGLIDVSVSTFLSTLVRATRQHSEEAQLSIHNLGKFIAAQLANQQITETLLFVMDA